MMQVHSHLLVHEIIGFLAGYCLDLNPNRKKAQTMIIAEAYPCETEAFQTADGKAADLERNVELSPESG